MRTHNRTETGRAASAAYCILAYAVAGAGAWSLVHFGKFNNPFVAALIADLVATAIVFLFSMKANNSSMYDPYWSVAPLPITLYWIFIAGGEPTLREIIIVMLILAWSIRLTHNWFLGWRGLDHEDWRYRSFRPHTGRAYWALSFLGFHLMPTLMVFMGLVPVYLVMKSSAPLNPLDALPIMITAAAITLEAVSDRQLRVYRRNRGTGENILDSGLWRYSRHPNYFGEILFWWGLYLFAPLASTSHLWAVVGPASMTLMFQFISVPMMEKHLEKHNPGYRQETAHISALLPLPSRTERRDKTPD
jgi:steroid 5-alpha reductase family enzyme